MKITLKEDVIPIKQRPYRLNPKYKGARMKLVPLFSATLEIRIAPPKCKSITHMHNFG